MQKERRAQTSLEMLLLVGGVIVMALIIGMMVKGIANQTATKTP